MTDSTFCNVCGAEIDPQRDLYCPKCGAPVKGGPADIQAREMYKAVARNTVRWAGFLMLFASIPSLVIGLDCLLNNSAIATNIWNIYEPVGFSYETLKDGVTAIGMASLAVGAFGIIGAILCFKRRYWIVALIAAIVLFFFGIFSFLGLFTSLLAMWFLFTAKYGFEEYASKI